MIIKVDTIYSEEENAVIKEIVDHFAKMGIHIAVEGEQLVNDPAHNLVITRIAREGFPITIRRQ